MAIAALLVLAGIFGVVERQRGPAGDDVGAPGSTPGTSAEPASEDSAGPGGQAAGRHLALALEGEGLRFFDVETGSASPIAFGTSAEVTRSALAAARDGEVVEEGESAECGNHFARLANGLTIWLRHDRFVGWSLRDPPLTTAGGIGIGSTRADLESVYDARIVNSSLGVEFSAGGLAGLLDSEAADSKVLNLWAGETCIAR